MNPELENRLQHNRLPTLVGHIFDSDGYSLCWKNNEWSDLLNRWFLPGIVHPQSVGLDDDGQICYYCAEKVRKCLKHKYRHE